MPRYGKSDRAQFTISGLGQQVQSWVSTGQNLPISADQIMQVLGGAKLQDLAQQVGITQEQAANGLADVLPEIVNQLTPSGNIQADAIAAVARECGASSARRGF